MNNGVLLGLWYLDINQENEILDRHGCVILWHLCIYRITSPKDKHYYGDYKFDYAHKVFTDQKWLEYIYQEISWEK